MTGNNLAVSEQLFLKKQLDVRNIGTNFNIDAKIWLFSFIWCCSKNLFMVRWVTAEILPGLFSSNFKAVE